MSAWILRGTAASAVVAAVGLLAAPTTAMASPAQVPRCTSSDAVAGNSPTWAQSAVDGRRLWPLTQGDGVRVAVLSTGVDARNAQFPAGSVVGGGDVLAAGQSPRADCDGRGTFLAGLVAARPAEASTFAGVAPRAEVVPIRVVETVTTDGGGTQQVGGTARELAAGIRLAVGQRASVVCIPLQVSRDSAELRVAVRAATDDGVLVVAGGSPPPDQQSGAPAGAAHAYPAEYPDVLSVAAIDKTGAVLGPTTDPDVTLDLAAPGTELVSTASGPGTGGLAHVGPRTDPGGAVALVAGVAALVRAYRPELTPAQLHERLVDTATPLATTAGHRTGAPRLVDASRAVTSDVVTARLGGYVALAVPPSAATGPAPAALVALTVAVLLLAATALSVLLALTVRGGRSSSGPRAASGAAGLP